MCTVWHVDKYKITFKLVINARRKSRGPAVEKRRSRKLVSEEALAHWKLLRQIKKKKNCSPVL